MGVYVVAQLLLTDEALYRRYQSRFAGVFAGSGGRLLVADEAPLVLEGTWTNDKLVIMEFDTSEAALNFLDSPAYQSISEDREAGAKTTALLVRGLGHSQG
jgi:uncharacterized protein (DUF1330 family)